MVDVDDTKETVDEPIAIIQKTPDPVPETKIVEPEPVSETVNPTLIKLAQDESIPLPPDRIEDEDKEARKARYDYLLSSYKDTALKDLPEDVLNYLTPEANVNAAFEWLWDEALKDNSAKRKESIVKDFTENKMTSMADVPLSLYLEKIIPCEQDWIYFMMFEDPNTINEVLSKCTTNRYKDFRSLSNFSVGVWHTATQKYMESNFEAIEKVS